MNILIIVLAIVIVLLAYYIYTIFTATPSLAKNIDLSKANVPTVPPSSIKNPYSVNYSIGVWIYVNNVSSLSSIGTFVSYGDANYGPPVGTNPSLWALRMDSAKPILYCDILTANGTSYKKQSITITNQFPAQKWVYVTTVVSSQYIECYINGGFIISQTITDGIFTPTQPANGSATATFQFGTTTTNTDTNTPVPVMLTNLSRWDYALSAGDVHNYYIKGNGQSASIWGPAYHLNINVAQGSNNYVLPVF